MVVVDTSFKRMQELIKEKITIEELEEVLSNMGMELDEVDGDEIKIEITAERVDLITPEGLARAINCYRGGEYEEVKVEKGDYLHKTDSSVKEYRPFTRSFAVKGLKFNDEKIKALMWIQEKIHDTYGRKRKKVSIGVYDLNKINFPVTYSAKKPTEIKFIPLGMDVELNGLQILQKHPTGRDYADLLEGKGKFPVQIDAKGQVLSMPPIINSNDLGKIDEETHDIFVEGTGPDEEALDSIMNILATMFNDWEGKVHSVDIEDDGKKVCPNLKASEREISLRLIKNLIGIKVKTEEAVKYLQMMGYKVVDKEKITVSIPSVRTDIWHGVDIADDVARAYGYNNIKPTIPNIATIGEMLPMNIFIEDLCGFLTGLGLIEVKTFALTNHQDQYVKMNIEENDHIALGKNTEDKNLSMVRSWLMPEVIKALVANRSQELPQNVFEVGTIVVPDSEADVKARNVDKLVCLLCDDKTDFTKIKQVLDAVMGYLGIKFEVKEMEHTSFISGRVGKVVIDGKDMGLIGEIHPSVLKNWDLVVPVVGMELDLGGLFNILSNLPIKEIKPLKEVKKEKRIEKPKKTSGEFEKVDTERLFYQDPYMKEAEAKVEEINGKEVILDKTLFFSFSGGQASDNGEINGIKIEDVKKQDNKIVHVLEKEPDFKVGDTVKLKLNWERRYNLMKLHSAAHLIYYPFVKHLGKPKISGSNINEDKARIDFMYDSPLTEKIPLIEKEANEVISKRLDIETKPDKKEPEKRWWKCEQWKMPCGGTHVKNTSEIGKIKLKRKNIGKGKERIEIILK